MYGRVAYTGAVMNFVFNWSSSTHLTDALGALTSWRRKIDINLREQRTAEDNYRAPRSTRRWAADEFRPDVGFV